MLTLILIVPTISSCDEQGSEAVYEDYNEEYVDDSEVEEYEEGFVLDEDFLSEEDSEDLDPPIPELATVAPVGEVVADEDWDRITKDISYERTKKEEPQAKDFNPGVNFGKGIETGFSVLVWVLVIALIVGFLAWLIMRTKVDNSVDKVRDFSVTDELLAASKKELEDALTQNLNAKEYRAAIRYRFGQILQEMRKQGFLIWVPGRTNAEYQEALSEPFNSSFGVLAKAFSYAMYSGREVRLVEYEDFAQKADAYLATFSSLSLKPNKR